MYQRGHLDISNGNIGYVENQQMNNIVRYKLKTTRYTIIKMLYLSRIIGKNKQSIR